MKIAPIDIAHKTFARKVMGLDADEVTDFLRDIADQMEEIIRERNNLKEAVRQKDLAIMEYRERDDALKATIHTATKMSDQIRGDAEREAKLIINDATQKADMILKDSRDSLKRVYQEIADLKRTRMQFEVNLRSLCQAHIAMLDQSHLTMPEPQINFSAASGMNQQQQQQQHPQHQQQHAQQAQHHQAQAATNAGTMGVGGAAAMAQNGGMQGYGHQTNHQAHASHGGHMNHAPLAAHGGHQGHAGQQSSLPTMGLGRTPVGKA